MEKYLSEMLMHDARMLFRMRSKTSNPRTGKMLKIFGNVQKIKQLELKFKIIFAIQSENGFETSGGKLVESPSSTEPESVRAISTTQEESNSGGGGQEERASVQHQNNYPIVGPDDKGSVHHPHNYQTAGQGEVQE